jgi:predicted enzyme involved in methoxymalonyl-ACP biosynthesis
MVNMFANIPEAIAHSTNIHREVNLLHHIPLVYALYATSLYEVSTMQSIELTGESKKRFCYFYLVLDSKSLVEERETASYDRKAEELLGEAKENLSKVKTTITTSTAITSVHHLHAYLANICAIIEAQFVCDLSLKDIHTSAMFVVAHTFALHL